MKDETRTNVPKYELVEFNGQIVRKYPNGDLRNERGQLLALPEQMFEHAITSENAHAFHKMRKDKILRAIESKLVDVTKTNIPAEAIAAIVGKRAEIAMSDDTRTGNEAAKIVLSAVDAYQDKTAEQTTVTRNEYVMDAETKELLERILESRRESIDATVTRNSDSDSAE